MDLGGGDGSGSPYRSAPYAPANVNTVTPVHHYSNPSRSSAGGYTSSASHKHERSYTEVSPEAYSTGPTTDQLLGTSKTSPFLSTNKAYSSSAAHPASTETKTYDTLEKVRRLGIDKGFNGDITFLSRMHGSESPTLLSGGAVNDINLEELDYYSLAVDTKRTTTTTTTGECCTLNSIVLFNFLETHIRAECSSFLFSYVCRSYTSLFRCKSTPQSVACACAVPGETAARVATSRLRESLRRKRRLIICIWNLYIHCLLE